MNREEKLTKLKAVAHKSDWLKHANRRRRWRFFIKINNRIKLRKLKRKRL